MLLLFPSLLGFLLPVMPLFGQSISHKAVRVIFNRNQIVPLPFFTLRWLLITLKIKSKFFTLAPNTLHGLECALYSLHFSYTVFPCPRVFAASPSGWNAAPHPVTEFGA